MPFQDNSEVNFRYRKLIFFVKPMLLPSLEPSRRDGSSEGHNIGFVYKLPKLQKIS